jgi:hypothetical protein
LEEYGDRAVVQAEVLAGIRKGVGYSSLA